VFMYYVCLYECNVCMYVYVFMYVCMSAGNFTTPTEGFS